MKAWMIKNNRGELLPMSGHWYKCTAIARFVDSCDWYDKPTWRKLKRDGFTVVKVIITEHMEARREAK